MSQHDLASPNENYERTSLVFETVMAGHLVHWQPLWPPNVHLASDRDRPWFPTTCGWLGWSTSSRVTRWTSLLTSDKAETQRLFEKHGVSTPRTGIFSTSEKRLARRFAEELGWPVVVKPRRGGCARGVSTNVRNGRMFDRALRRLEEDGFGNDDFLVQEHIAGPMYRILASQDRIYGAYYNIPTRVIGDGDSSVEQLVERANHSRMKNPHLSEDGRAIRIDQDALALLTDQGLLPSSVPEIGREVPLATVDNPNRGTDTVEVSGKTHQSVDELAMQAVRSIPGLDYAGVDVILRDGHEVPAAPENSAVLEVNCGAGLGGHLYPVYGAPRNVCREIVLDTTGAAGLAPPEHPTDGWAVVAVRLMHRQGPELDEVEKTNCGPAGVEPLISREGAALTVLEGTRSALYESLHDRLAKDFGTIIATRIDDLPERHTPDTLDWLLQPSPFLPLRHGEMLNLADFERP